jgi:hypothetical protein
MKREMVGSLEGEASSKSNLSLAVTTAMTSARALVNQSEAQRSFPRQFS